MISSGNAVGGSYILPTTAKNVKFPSCALKLILLCAKRCKVSRVGIHINTK